MSARSDESTAKRRKVRKGTHSCWECRRRKVKCIFGSPDDATCVTCRQRKTECVSQLSSDGPDTRDYNTEHEERRAAPDGQLVGEHGYNARPRTRDGLVDPLTSSSISPAPVVSLPSSASVSWTMCLSGHSLTTIPSTSISPLALDLTDIPSDL